LEVDHGNPLGILHEPAYILMIPWRGSGGSLTGPSEPREPRHVDARDFLACQVLDCNTSMSVKQLDVTVDKSERTGQEVLLRLDYSDLLLAV
jgi:hypothetical protein